MWFVHACLYPAGACNPTTAGELGEVAAGVLVVIAGWVGFMVLMLWLNGD